MDNDFVMYHDPIKNAGLEVYKCPNEINPQNFIWNEHTQKLTVLKWPDNGTELNIRIVPGIRDFEEPND
jgi:hypothetical protein